LNASTDPISGAGAPVTNHHTHTYSSHIGATGHHQCAFCSEILDRSRRQHRDVEGLPCLDAPAQCADRGIVDRDLVAGLPFEIGQQGEQHLFERAGGQDLDFRGDALCWRTSGRKQSRNAQPSEPHRLLPGFEAS
jgi:hypothetical protein